MLEGADAALNRLQLDYVDLIFCHQPDFHTPVEETVRAMTHLIDQGKALYWGTSEWTGERIREACEIARREHLIAPVMEQPQYHMFHRERVEKEYARLYADCGLGTTIWSPLASGLLTGKYAGGVPDDSRLALPEYQWLRDQIMTDEGKRRIEKAAQMTPIAEELGMTTAQLAIAWCLKNPNVSTVIMGASKVGQLEENLKAMDFVSALTDDVMERIEAILENKPVMDRDWRNISP
jgi:voltage-dependent potassium channel beta subunit